MVITGTGRIVSKSNSCSSLLKLCSSCSLGWALVQFYQSPKPELVLLPFPSLPFFPSPSHFLHQLQTSITQSFFKLECFLRPFLKTRSHDRSAHTFGPSLQFVKVPQKVFFIYFVVVVVGIFDHIFSHIWSYQIH